MSTLLTAIFAGMPQHAARADDDAGAKFSG
jgi:hypothetical protein